MHKAAHERPLMPRENDQKEKVRNEGYNGGVD